MTDCAIDELPNYFEYDFDGGMLDNFSDVISVDNAFNWEPNQESNWETKSISSVSSGGNSEYSAETDVLPFFNVDIGTNENETISTMKTTHMNKTETDSEKLRKNREAASRCRKKKRESQLKSQTEMDDLENQLHVTKNENEALLIENKSLKAENRTLRESVASLSFETKASISGVAIFGIVCLFPIFNININPNDIELTSATVPDAASSTGSSYSMGHIVSNMSTFIQGQGNAHGVASGSGASCGTGRVLLSVRDTISGGSTTLHYTCLVGLLLLITFIYQNTKPHQINKYPVLLRLSSLLHNAVNQCKMTLPI